MYLFFLDYASNCRIVFESKIFVGKTYKAGARIEGE
jgi:hypothetical protein